ncbi:MAG TPA: hypothetical protein VHY35_21490 [Stellaceae bacterium]|jgi:hypothetical protein|nr:hypothetical protein [Stellaceae bacterium]
MPLRALEQMLAAIEEGPPELREQAKHDLMEIFRSMEMTLMPVRHHNVDPVGSWAPMNLSPWKPRPDITASGHRCPICQKFH